MWYVLKSPSLSLFVREELSKVKIEYFLPTHTLLANIGGQKKRIEKPIVFNFVFIRCVFDVARDFCRDRPALRLHILYNHKSLLDGGNALPVTISDHRMDMFQKAILFYNGTEVPFIKPEEMDLEKGDLVRIIGGKFSGLEGVLISQKGKDGGRVVIHLDNVCAVSTLEIEPEYLQILKYGKDNKHFYKHLEGYIPRLEYVRSISGRNPTVAELSPVVTFISRFSELQTETINAKAKILSLLYASYRLTGDSNNADKIYALIQDIIPKIKSKLTMDFINYWIK